MLAKESNTDVSISEARFSLAESELMETSNIINSINAKYLSVFGEKPNKPEIKIPIDFDDFESFPRPGYGYGTAEMPDMTPEIARFLDMGWLRLPISLDFLGFPWISLILIGFSWFYKDFHGFESISNDFLDDHWI